jgi:type I restriction enzyme, S subunit
MSFSRHAGYKRCDDETLSSIPQHWDSARFQRYVDVAEGQVNPEDHPYSEMLLVAPNHIESATGRLLELETATEQGAESGKYWCNAGDVVYSKIRPALRKVCIAPEDCLCSADMYPLRSHTRLTNPYLFWLLLSEEFSAVAVLESQRVAMPKINRETLNAVRLPLPPDDEQAAISSFLDVETSKIDGLVSEQRRLIELLKEKRQAVISHAVTKGLNPNAPMKPSHIQWLGDVPQHWQVMKLGRVTIDRCDGPFGSGLKSSHYADEGIRVVRLNNIRHNRFDDSDAAFIDPDHYNGELRGGHDVIAGDLLIAGLGDAKNAVGRACVTPDGIEPAMVKADCFRYRLDKERVLTSFMSAQLTIGAPTDAGLMSTGTTRSRMPLSVTSSRKIAFPDLAEQGEIAEFIDGRTEQFDSLVSEAERAIELLQERRTALISAAVTGKIDVREFAYQETA